MGKRTKKKKLRIRRVLLVLIVFVLVVLIEVKIDKKDRKDQSTFVASISDDIYLQFNKPKLNMTIIGDIMCHNTQYEDAYNSSTGEYDFSYVFEDIEDYIRKADLAIGNLETTFAGKQIGYSSYPTFNTPEAMATDLKELGLDVLTTTNNHSLDKGYTGIVNTIAELDKVGIAHTGTYDSEEASNEILTQEVNGFKIAFVAYTYGTNGIPVPSGKDYCINLINDEKIKSDLKKAKELKPDLIVASMHWGIEYAQAPNAEQERLADLLFENGVDLILGSHPHVLEKMEKREITLEDGTKKDGFIIYSLGNFISGQRKEFTKQSIILNLELSKNGKEGKIAIDNISYIPIYMYKGQKYKVLDIEKQIEKYDEGKGNIDAGTYSTLKSELSHIKKILD